MLTQSRKERKVKNALFFFANFAALREPLKNLCNL
jgi:hypothetical protein